MTKVEEYLNRLFDSVPRVGRAASLDVRERFIGVGTFTFGIHQNRTAPFRMSRPDVLPLIKPYIPGITDSGLRRTLDSLVEAGFIVRMTEDTARNSKMPHLYYWSSESLKALDLAGPDLAVTLPEAMREPQGSKDLSKVEMQPTHFDQVSTGFDYNRNIPSLGEDIMVETRSKPSRDSIDWRARTEAYAENQGRGRFDRVSTKEKIVSTKHGRKGVPEGFDLPPVEVIPSDEVIGGVPLVGRTPDGRPLTGSVAGMEALFEQEAAGRLDAVRPVKPTFVDDRDPFSLAAISKRVGFTVKGIEETREERAARIAEEDAERRRLVEAEIRRRLQASIESEAETRIFLMTTPEGREAVDAVMREKAELKAEPLWKPKQAEADEAAA